MKLTFNCPVNSVSFGQVSVALLKEAYERGCGVTLLPIGEKLDLSSQDNSDEAFQKWLTGAVKYFQRDHDRNSPALKLWHINSSLGWLSDKQILFTFYELDDPTDTEVSILKQQPLTLVSSRYTQEVLESKGVNNVKYCALGFDSRNFKRIDKEYFSDERIVFNLCGKYEYRKRHEKILKAWAKKFGNNRKYFLQCALYNPFLDGQANNELIARALGHKKFFNMNFFPHMKTNAEYNDFLNSGDIVIGMSGAEGWGLPEFQSVALGKHAVMLNAHAYKGWANKDNAVMVDPSGKIDAYDEMFFKKGQEFNQGQIYDWDEDDFISACEEAIKRAEDNRVNEAGLLIPENFSYSSTFDTIWKELETL
tara:strand:- start:708 stop:1802 length:1095 start_codon:yes stop_codon:yes gene_type:complete